jgi:hypothetical protein
VSHANARLRCWMALHRCRREGEVCVDCGTALLGSRCGLTRRLVHRPSSAGTPRPTVS